MYILDLTKFPANSANRIIRSTMFQIHAMELGARWPTPTPECYPTCIHHENENYVYVFKDDKGVWWLDWTDSLNDIGADATPYYGCRIHLSSFLNMEALPC